MDRKTAMATAGAIVVTLVAAAVALAANMGLLGFTSGPQRSMRSVGELVSAAPQPTVAPTPQIVTVYVDAPASDPGAAPAVTMAPQDQVVLADAGPPVLDTAPADPAPATHGEHGDDGAERDD